MSTLAVAAVAVVALIAAGPTTVVAADDSVPGDTSTSGSAATTDGAEASAGVAPADDMDYLLDVLLGLVPESDANEYWAQQSAAQDRAVQQCMNDAGFEYNLADTDSAVDPYHGVTELEFAQQWGYGIWTAMDPDHSPYEAEAAAGDPNEEILRALTESERNAWLQIVDRCAEANLAIGAPALNPMVQQILADFDTRVDSDPRMREALATWRECMADAGFVFASTQEMYDTASGGEENRELFTQFFLSRAWNPTSPDHEQWQAMVDQEIAIAVADATCSPALGAVRVEVVADLRPELVEVWLTVDWSLQPELGPPIDLPGVIDGGDAAELEPSVTRPDGTGDSTEAPVVLDLSDPTETTEP